MLDAGIRQKRVAATFNVFHSPVENCTRHLKQPEVKMTDNVLETKGDNSLVELRICRQPQEGSYSFFCGCNTKQPRTDGTFGRSKIRRRLES